MPARDKEIALAFPRGSHQEVFFEGILQYAKERRRRWSFIIAPEWNSVSITQLVGWTGHGVIAALNTQKEARCAAEFHLPVVNMSSALEESPVPRTMVDNRQIGRLAADHLIDRGFKAFAYYGLRDIQYSHQRMEGFEERVSESGGALHRLLQRSTFQIRGDYWLRQQQEVKKWLVGLPKPCGMFTVSDARARQAINACQAVNLRVPEDIAVIGVDDQQIICEHVSPTITSIARNNIQEGYAAARMLDRLLQKKKPPKKDELIPPLGIVERESTATLATADHRLREAIAYFQAHIEDPVTVAELCNHISVSRRWLEYAFREGVGESPFSYIRKQKLNYARQLLTEEPDTKVHRIARRIGMPSAKHFAKAFRREFGVTPSEYRNSSQA